MNECLFKHKNSSLYRVQKYKNNKIYKKNINQLKIVILLLR